MFWNKRNHQLVAVANILLVLFTVSVAQVVTRSERCGYKDIPVSTTQQDVEMYGVCVPYDSSTVPGGTPCDPLYTQEVTHVYIPNTRLGNLERYLPFFRDTQLTFDLVPERCIDEARTILCHYFLPPCGNTTVFEPPTSVCEDVCEYLRSLCPDEFQLLEAYFEQREDVLSPSGLTMINCSDTGEYLNELDYCCSDLSIDIPCMKVNSSGDLVPDPLCEPSGTTNAPTDNDSLNVGEYAGISAAIVIIIVIITLIIISLAILTRRHKHHKQTQKVKDPGTEEGRSKSSDTTRYWQSNDDQLLSPHPPHSTLRAARVSSGYIRQMADINLLIPGRSLDLMDTLGQGEFGVVYRGKLKAWGTKGEECHVAAKTLKGVFGTSELSNLMEESMKMSKFNHPNVMKLIGVCIEKGTSPYIVMPYMAYGSLLSYLRKKRPELTIASDHDTELVTATQSKLLSMCLQVSKGMSYLATQQFVHRDLAARNCMIDENFVLKVADFGLSEDIYSKHYFRQGVKVKDEEGETPVKLPVRWMAIESLHDGIFTEKSDVWAFGVTMWEIFTLGKIPYPGVDSFSVTQFLDDGRRLSLPGNAACSQDIYTIMCHCWAANPDQRPNFSDLVSTVTNILESIGGYLTFSAADFPQPQISSYDHLIPVQSLEDHPKPTVIISDCDPGNEVDNSKKL